jgi:putative acetyltransferase
MALIRLEKPADFDAVHRLNELAFEGPAEAGIVDRLRERCPDIISLVAEEEGEIVGHIFFSTVELESGGEIHLGMGLAPMAVLPEHQRKGIGSELVKAGLAELKKIDCPFVIVIGHPEYYPRFGFELASARGIRSEWEVPEEAFMIIVFDDTRMPEEGGVARYRPEFSEAM